MKDRLKTLPQTTSPDLSSVISSREFQSGATLFDSQNGPTTDPYGREVRPVNPFPRRAKRKSLRIDDTFGQNTLGSSEHADRLYYFANKYRERTATLGSTLFAITWKMRRTPAGRLIYSQQGSALHTSEAECSSWPTPQVHDVTTRGNTEADHHYSAHDLSNAALMTGWPTPCSQDGPNGGPNQGIDRLPGAAAMASWPTPTTRDHKDGTSEGTAPVNALLGRTAWLAGWSTPRTVDASNETWETKQIRNARHLATSLSSSRTKGVGGQTLPIQAQSCQWPAIPDAMDAAKLLGLEAELARLMATGVTQVGFYADQNGPAVIPLGGPLNAGLSRWLMSLPQIWDTCALTALGSLPRSRKKRSIEPVGSTATETA
ncbi:MAG: hypothetical protein WAN65_10145 [Candidatus Sulfotelmatobacter sp.]